MKASHLEAEYTEDSQHFENQAGVANWQGRLM